jgi:hypothetical protein
MVIMVGIGGTGFTAITANNTIATTLLTKNLLTNGSFDLGSKIPVTITGLNDPSQATGWTTWNKNYDGGSSSYGTLTTALVPSTLVTGGTMIHVETSGTDNGLVQVFGEIDTGPKTAYACAWIYVVRGTVGISLGNGGNQHLGVLLSAENSWERVEISNSSTYSTSPVNEFIIYSSEVGGAEFYVESASVTRGRSSCSAE